MSAVVVASKATMARHLARGMAMCVRVTSAGMTCVFMDA